MKTTRRQVPSAEGALARSANSRQLVPTDPAILEKQGYQPRSDCSTGWTPRIRPVITSIFRFFSWSLSVDLELRILLTAFFSTRAILAVLVELRKVDRLRCRPSQSRYAECSVLHHGEGPIVPRRGCVRQISSFQWMRRPRLNASSGNNPSNLSWYLVTVYRKRAEASADPRPGIRLPQSLRGRRSPPCQRAPRPPMRP